MQIDDLVSPGINDSPRNINHNQVEFHNNTHSEHENSTVRLAGLNLDENFYRFQGSNNQTYENQNTPLVKNRFASGQITEIPMSERKLKNRTASFPVLHQATGIMNFTNHYNESVQVEQLSSDSNSGDNKGDKISCGRFIIEDKTPKISNTSKVREQTDETDHFHNDATSPNELGTVNDYLREAPIAKTDLDEHRNEYDIRPKGFIKEDNFDTNTNFKEKVIQDESNKLVDCMPRLPIANKDFKNVEPQK